MDAQQIKLKLESLDACSDARLWADGKTLSEIWAECPRGDWMLWLAQRAGINKRQLTAAKAECAATVRHLMKDPRSIKALETAQAYGSGEATDEELDAAADAADAAAADAAYAAYAAYAADAADAAYAAYAAAADAAAYAAAAAADTAYAAYAYAAAYAAYAYADTAYAAYAYAAAAAADADARKQSQMRTAEIVRAIIKVEDLKL